MTPDPYRALIRLVWLGVTASCLSLAGFTLWGDLRDREHIVATARATTADVARALDQEATQLLASVDMLLTAAASRVDAQETGARERYTQALLADIAPRVPHVVGLRILGAADQTQRFSYGDTAEAQSIDAAVLAALDAAQADSLVVGVPVWDPIRKEWILGVGRRISARQSGDRLIAIATISLDELQRFYETLDLERKGTVVLYRADGVLLVRHPYVEANVGKTFIGPTIRAAQTQKTGDLEHVSPVDGVARYSSFRNLRGLPLIVLVTASKEDVLAPWQAEIQRDSAALSAVTALFVVFGLGLSSALRKRGQLEEQSRASTVQLAESEERYRLLAENTSDLIVFKPTMTGRRGYVSPAVRAILGWEPDEYAALPSAEIIHPDEMADLSAAYASLSPDGPQITRVHRLRHKAGHYVWIESVFKLVGLDPRDRTVVVSGRDVTARREADEALRQSDARYRLLSEAATDMVTHMDLSGQRLYVSPASRDLLGYEPHELIGTSPQQTIHPDDAASLRMLLDDLITGRRERGVNVNRLRHRDGRWIWVEASLKRLQDVSGRSTGFVASVRNIAERRRSDDALRESEARYRMLAENTSDVITRLSLDFKRTYVSPSCRRLFGHSPDEMLGDQPSASIHPDDAPGVRALARQLAAGHVIGDQVVATYRAKHRFGPWVWIEATLNLARDEVGAPDSIVCVLRDAGARKADEAVLLAAREQAEMARAEAERASVAKGEFLASMSHEIRTPLNGVIGYADLLLDEPGITGRVRQYGERIRSAGAALLTVVNDILDFSKIEAGQVDIAAQPFAPAALVDNAVSIVRGLAEAKGLTLDVDLDPALPTWLSGDEDRLRQVLLNLLNNAIKFTVAGRVGLRVTADADTDPVRLVFAVTDTGIGIPADKRGRLFQRFSQIDGSYRRSYGGTGLGLAISKSLIELMGGAIGVESDEGRGSTFWFEVTLHKALAPRPIAGKDDAVPVRLGYRLLLAEDVPLNQDLARVLLEAGGHTVDMVSNGAEAISAAESTPYDLILMDVQMPVMDGVSATRRIRALAGPASAVPIIALTANVLPQQVDEFRAAGMSGHVGKPFRRDELLAAIDRWAGPSAGSQAATVAEMSASVPQIDPEVLDTSVLREMEENFGADRVGDLLGLLARELSERFRPNEVDRSRIAHDAHAMISAAGMLGFVGLSSLCREVEAAAHAGSDLVPLIHRLEVQRVTTLNTIRELRAA